MPQGLLDDDKHNISASLMLTQRFVYRHKQYHYLGKNFLNLKRRPREIKILDMSVHRVSLSCPTEVDSSKIDHEKLSLIRVHHYLGTKEQYFFRSDPRDVANSSTVTSKKPIGYKRRDAKQYETLAKQATLLDPIAKDWVRGFVQNVGLENAKRLLEGVGIPGYSVA